MKTIKTAAIAALLVTSITSTPASAAKPPLGPPTTDGLTAQEVCDLQLTPDEHSDFETYPINVVDSGWVNVGDPYADTPAGDPEGYGTPTPSGTVFDGTYIRHGGSPNVWGGASATLTYPQTRQLFNFLQDVQRTVGFDCYVYKIVGHDTLVDPAGLQSVGNSTVEGDSISAGTDYVITEDDFVVYGEAVDVLICISPNNATKSKPGTWTRMHGFAGSCTDASYQAGLSFIPSHNNPTTDAGISH